jgi:hypothetical protein
MRPIDERPWSRLLGPRTDDRGILYNEPAWTSSEYLGLWVPSAYSIQGEYSFSNQPCGDIVDISVTESRGISEGGSRTRTIRIFTMTNVMDNICGEDALHFSTQRLMRVVLDRPNSELCYTGRWSLYIPKWWIWVLCNGTNMAPPG